MHEVSKRVRFRALFKGGMSKAAISRELGISRRTATRWAAADDVGRGSEALTYGPRAAVPSVLNPYQEIVRLRWSEYPDLSAERLFRELRESGYQGGYDVVKRYVREVRPQPGKQSVVRFETAPGRQGQVDFAEFRLPWGKRYALLVVLGFLGCCGSSSTSARRWKCWYGIWSRRLGVSAGCLGSCCSIS